MLMFRHEDRERVARGEITVTFRLWKSAHVKTGKTYESGFGRVQVEDVQVIPAAMVSEDDVPASGCADVAAILQLAGEHTKVRVEPDTLLYRVQFRFLGDEMIPVEPRPTPPATSAASRRSPRTRGRSRS